MKSVAPSQSPVEDDIVVSDSPSAEPASDTHAIQQRSYTGVNLFALLLTIIALAAVGQFFLISTPPNLLAGVALLTIAGGAFVVLRSWMRDPAPDSNPPISPAVRRSAGSSSPVLPAVHAGAGERRYRILVRSDAQRCNRDPL
jgi:hypothetical protein